MVKKTTEYIFNNKQDDLVKINILGVAVTNAKKASILEFVFKSLATSVATYFIVTPNPEMIVYAHKHVAFKKILNSAKIALCDGMQLYRSAQVLGTPLMERITGVDFMEDLCRLASQRAVSVGFFGGKDKVAELTAHRLKEKYPKLKVAFIGEAWDENALTSDEYPDPKNHIRDTKVDILFVAFGFPKQEEWMFENSSKLPVRVMVGVGGAFDYLSGRVSRAPKYMQSVGFEWLYRLIKQPWRWRRQVQLFQFIIMVLKEKYKFF